MIVIRRARLVGLVAGCLLAGTTIAGSSASPASSVAVAQALLSRVPSGDWTTFDFNARRSGVGPADTGITSGDLRLLRRRVVELDGTVDSSPVAVHTVRIRGRIRDAVIVTTTYGRTLAINAATGARLWEYVPPGIRTYEGSAQITNASPVVDPGRRYVFAASPDGRVRKLAISSGREIRSGHWPVSISLDPSREKMASALNIIGPYVLASTGGYTGDAPPYQGHLVEITRSDGRVVHVFNTLCSSRHRLITPRSCPASGSAIWARAGAVVEPGSGRILIATGNGDFNGRTDWGDSVLELSPSLSLLHNWTPPDQQHLNNTDTDLGSTSPALLPTSGGYRLAMQGGKDGLMRLLSLGRLDGTPGRAGLRFGGELQSIRSPGGTEVLTAPAVAVEHGRAFVFVADDSGTEAYVLGGDRRLHEAWERGTPGTSPVLAGGLLYVYDQRDGGLVVRSPASGRMLTSLPAGSGHWNSPAVVGGRIFLPEGDANQHATSGVLDIYHLPGH
ncbi:MAG: outer membrane protein assembly factor BamB family protein [Solirubrobacteraceae bacterium]